jgi:hypothetical protein
MTGRIEGRALRKDGTMQTETWGLIRTIDGVYAYFGTHAQAVEQMVDHGALCGFARLHHATPAEAARAYGSVRRAVRSRSYEALRRGAGLPSTGESGWAWHVLERAEVPIQALFATALETDTRCATSPENDLGPPLTWRAAQPAEEGRFLAHLQARLGEQTVRVLTSPAARTPRRLERSLRRPAQAALGAFFS